MPRNAFRARFHGDASVPRRRTPPPDARLRAGAPEPRTGRAPSAERDAERPPVGAEPVPQADGHP